MAAFEPAIEIVLRHEGGLVFNPSDPGGITNFGISLRFLKSLNPKSVADDIRLLTKESAIALYRLHFWDLDKYALIADQKICNKVFDFAINMGPGNSIKCLQRAIRATNGRIEGETGQLDTNTLHAINHSPPDCVYAALKSEAAGHYRELVLQNSHLSQFIHGWLTRAYADT